MDVSECEEMERPGKINGIAYSNISVRTGPLTTRIAYPGGIVQMAGVSVAFRGRAVAISGVTSEFGVTRVILLAPETHFSDDDLEIERIFKGLSTAKKKILVLTFAGWRDAEIAKEMGISIHTVRNHRKAVKRQDLLLGKQIFRKRVSASNG